MALVMDLFFTIDFLRRLCYNVFQEEQTKYRIRKKLFMMKKMNAKRIFAWTGAAAIALSATLSFTSCALLEWLFPGETAEKYQPYQKDYSARERAQIQSSSFKKLNDIPYPDGAGQEEIDKEYKAAMAAFADKLYALTAERGKNFSFSPMGLFNLLSIASLASDDGESLSAIDEFLGADSALRAENFAKVYKNDYICNDLGTLQLCNGSFQSNLYDPNPDYIGVLTDYYTEAYSLDFQNPSDVNEILKWIDSAVHSQNFMTEKELGITEDTVMMLFSTTYFNNRWASVFETSDTAEGVFYAADGESKASFMKHTYFGECYDYEDYLACYDYYCNRMKVKYILPKEKDGDIYSLVEGKSIVTDDPSRQILTSVPEWADEETYDRSQLVVNLTVPKFKSSYQLDFTDVLKENGLDCLFDEYGRSFNHAFTGLPADFSAYLKFVRQKNEVSFDEDGTTIKTVTYGEFAGATSAPMEADTVDITLDRPFIYVIYDVNDLPIYVGHVDKPTM